MPTTIDGREIKPMHSLFTYPTNISGHPSFTVPCGVNAAGLPVGLQIIGNYFAEAQMLNIAHQFQQNTQFHDLAPAGIQ